MKVPSAKRAEHILSTILVLCIPLFYRFVNNCGNFENLPKENGKESREAVAEKPNAVLKYTIIYYHSRL